MAFSDNNALLDEHLEDFTRRLGADRCLPPCHHVSRRVEDTAAGLNTRHGLRDCCIDDNTFVSHGKINKPSGKTNTGEDGYQHEPLERPRPTISRLCRAVDLEIIQQILTIHGQ